MSRIHRPLLALTTLFALGLAERATAQLAAVGPVSPDHGFPVWYRDAQAAQLDLCLPNAALCLLDAAVQLLNPNQPFPNNFAGTFPDESFYWVGEASMPTNNGGEALLVMALEAGFVNGVVVAGEQMTF